MNVLLSRLVPILTAISFVSLSAHAEYGTFTDVPSGSDIVMKEVRWPYWNGNYYNTWYEDYWSSSDGVGGYFYNGLGLPSAGSPNPVGGKHVVNWSFWPLSSPINISDSIASVYSSPNTFAMPTIGEGTMFRSPGNWGLWQTNVWYRMVIRTWQPVGGAAHQGFAGTWMRDASSGIWYHAASIQVPFAVTGISGSDSFQENASGGLQPQRTDYRLSYYHYNGTWHSSTNWHAYVSSNNSIENAGLLTNSVDGTNTAVFYEVCETNNTSYTGTLTHGMTSPTYRITQPSTPPFDPTIVTNYGSSLYGNQLLVQWQVPPTSSPQFAYQINVYTNASYTGNLAATVYEIAPDIRQKLITLPAGATPYPQITVIDIFNQTNAAISIGVTNVGVNTAATVTGAINGLSYAYYQSATSYTSDSQTNWSVMPNFASLTPVSQGAVAGLDQTPRQRRNGYAFNYNGYIYAPSNGLYAFTLNSCDGSILSVDGQQIINWDGKHSPADQGGWVGLQAGYHALNVQYFFDVQPTSLFSDYFDNLTLSWEGPGISKTVVPVTAFYRVPGGSEPSITLTSPTNGTTAAVAGVPLSATVTANGNTVNKILFYVGNYFWGQDTIAPYSLSSFFWANTNNPVHARLLYNSTNIVDSAVNVVTTTNTTLSPWQYGQIFYHNEPSGASIQNGTYSVIGDGVNLLTRQVSGDCTLIAHLAGITSSATAPDGSTANTGWQAGIIMRGTTNMTPGYPWGQSGSAPFAAVFGQVDGGAYYQNELMVNGGGGYGSGNLGGQKWFKLVRSNLTNFTSYVSADGATWTLVSNTNLTDFGTSLYAGFFTYAGPSSNPNVHWASFDNVSLTGNIVGPPTVAVTPQTDTAYSGQTTTFTALPGGTAPFYYQWQLNGLNLSGATNATLTLTNLQPSASGLYTALLTNANGSASATASLTVLTPAPGVAQIISNSPLAYLRLNETAGPTAYDSVGNYNGTGQGGILFGVPGVTNAPFNGFENGNLAAQFGGDSSPSDIAISPFNVTTTNFSITGWVNCNGTQDSWSGLAFSRGSGHGVGLMVVNNGGNELRYGWNDDGNDYNSGTGFKMSSGKWAFVALTITPTNAIVYFATNATLHAWTNTTANIGQTFSGSFYLGCDPSSLLSSSRQFNGTLDEFAFYNRTLTGAQITQLLAASQTSVPGVALTVPASGANFGAPATINLSASVVTNGHAINSVQFYNGATLLGQATAAPYAYAWNNVPVGSYTLLAQVTYDSTGTQSSSPAFVTVNPLPTTPQNLSVVAVASNEISVAWSAVANANGYTISRNGSLVATVNGTGWLDTGLTPNTTYAYSVTATSPWGNSPSSLTNSATTFSSGNGLAWDANSVTAGPQDGSGNWGGTNTNWWNGSSIVAWADGDIATFGAGISGGNTVTLINDATPAGVAFAGLPGAYTLAGGGGGINLSGAIPFNCAVDGAVSAVIKGAGSLVKTGSGTLALSGANLYTGNTTISNGTLQIATSGTLLGNVTNNAALVFNSSSAVTFTNRISGSGSVAQAGAGTVYLTNANTYAGGTTISNSVLSLGNGNASSENVNATGTGTVTVKSGGRFQFFINGSTTVYNITNAVVLDGGTIWSQDGYQHVTGPVTVTANGGTLSQYYDTKGLWIDGLVSGAGPLLVNNPNTGAYQPYGGVHFSNPLNSYSGTITVSANSVTVDNTYALSNAIVNVMGAGSSGPLQWGSGVNSIVLGGLSGSYNIANGGKALSVGNNSSNTVYSGVLSGTGSLAKLGAGTFALANANTYTGVTTVNAGTLEVDGSIGTNTVTVASGGTLAGSGTVNGAVNVQSGGTLVTGPAGISALTIAKTLNLAGTVGLRINGTSQTADEVQGLTQVVYGGALTVTNLGGTPVLNQSYTLFSAGSYSGSFTATNLPGGLALGTKWNWNPANGTLSVVAGGPTGPVGITNRINGNTLTLTWPAGQSWRLVSQTNNLSAGMGNNWGTVSGASDGSMTITIDPGQPAVFYQLVYP